MTDDEKVIRECLRASVEGPFFPDWEFHTLFGLSREEVAAVLDSWPAFPDQDAQRVAVDNALNNLLGYPHGQSEVWSEYISVSPEEVRGLLERWAR